MFDSKKWEKEKIEEVVELIRIERREIEAHRSYTVKKDREKRIKELKDDLKEFCKYRNLDFEELEKKYGI